MDSQLRRAMATETRVVIRSRRISPPVGGCVSRHVRGVLANRDADRLLMPNQPAIQSLPVGAVYLRRRAAATEAFFQPLPAQVWILTVVLAAAGVLSTNHVLTPG